jgi:cell division protein ZapD
LDTDSVIIYEFPFNERIRSLLRLESLFAKVIHFTKTNGAIEHHMALNGLFEILDAVGRSDPKMDLLQELERQRQVLHGYRDYPDILHTVLDCSLNEIELAKVALHTLHGRFGQALRDNEWLMSIKHKAALPGGACGFDIPSYQYWLKQPSPVRRAALEQWQASVMPAKSAIEIILRLLRGNCEMSSLVAQNGQYEKVLGGARFQMVRLCLGEKESLIPEISANRYVLCIRFVMPPESETKGHLCPQDVPFELGFCSL